MTGGYWGLEQARHVPSPTPPPGARRTGPSRGGGGPPAVSGRAFGRTTPQPHLRGSLLLHPGGAGSARSGFRRSELPGRDPGARQPHAGHPVRFGFARCRSATGKPHPGRLARRVPARRQPCRGGAAGLRPARRADRPAGQARRLSNPATRTSARRAQQREPFRREPGRRANDRDGRDVGRFHRRQSRRRPNGRRQAYARGSGWRGSQRRRPCRCGPFWRLHEAHGARRRQPRARPTAGCRPERRASGAPARNRR